MSFRLVDAGWDHELAEGLRAARAHLRIVCPFIKKGALQRLLKIARPAAIQVITRFNQVDFAEGVSDLGALRSLLEFGAQVRGVRNLHAKLYLFDVDRAVVTSANLTDAALLRNHELGFVAKDPAVVDRCRDYFERLWSRAGTDLTAKRLADWDAKVTRYLAKGARPDRPSGLTDEGVDAGIAVDGLPFAPFVANATQAFVKFLGEGSSRVPLSFLTLDEVQRAGCHWAVAYPDKKRPTGVQEGALIFIGRLTKDPNDIRVFGRAVGMRYEPGRDDATKEDKALRPWKKAWPRYVRVHHAEFVSGCMENGVSLNELMVNLTSQAFAATQRNAASGKGNTNPRTAYRQQAAVELSREALAWLTVRLEMAFAVHGKLTPADLAGLDWPVVPRSRSRGAQ